MEPLTGSAGGLKYIMAFGVNPPKDGQVNVSFLDLYYTKNQTETKKRPDGVSGRGYTARWRIISQDIAMPFWEQRSVLFNSEGCDTRTAI